MQDPIPGWDMGGQDLPMGLPAFAGVFALPKPAPTSLLAAGEVSDGICHPSAMRDMSPGLSSDTAGRRGRDGGSWSSTPLRTLLCPSPAPMGTHPAHWDAHLWGILAAVGTMLEPGANPSLSVTKPHQYSSPIWPQFWSSAASREVPGFLQVLRVKVGP